MALVEFAIVAPIVFLLLFGMVDFGSAYGDFISVRNGVREGARLAVVNTPGSATCTLAAAAPNAATTNLVCLTKDRIGINAADVRVAIVLRDGSDAGSTVGDAGDPVVVCAQTPARSRSGITAPFLNGRQIRSRTEMRLEVAPSFQNYNEGGVSCS